MMNALAIRAIFRLHYRQSVNSQGIAINWQFTFKNPIFARTAEA